MKKSESGSTSQIKTEIEKALEKAVGKKLALQEAAEGHGDFALPCFELARELRKSPQAIAEDFAKKIKMPSAAVKAEGGYLNFYIDWKIFGQELLESVGEKYGSGNGGKKILIDTFQPNPFKAVHIGHLRNGSVGDSIRRILEFEGNKVSTVSFMGDVGAHIAKWLWYYNKFHNGKVPEKNVSKWAGEIYATATKKMEEMEEYEKEVKEVNKKLDGREPKLTKQWKELRDVFFQDFLRIAKELGLRLDDYIPESVSEEPGKKLVMKFFSEGRLKKSDGAIVIDLEKCGLGVFILLKSDGTALYSTKDFGLFELKRKKFKFDKSLYVVASEQDFYFRQLFKAFEFLEMPGWEKCFHVSHGIVKLQEGKMSSRLGTVVLYEDLRDEAIKRVLKIIEEKNPELPNKEAVAKKIALGALKFAMLFVENSRDIVFDWERVLDFEGRSGPYLQYTYARACGILRDASLPKKFDAKLLADDAEVALMKKIAQFPNAVADAAKDYSPHIIANYDIELAQAFNTFYNKLSVLKAESKELRDARLKIVDAARTVLKSGLQLLGIDALERM
ncbi:MAG: arginine--tRNA ligase [Candidatus Aenigmatarchaeota archaeon]